MNAGCRRVLTLALTAACAGAPALELAYEPTSLDWTAGEVGRIGTETLQQTVAGAAARDRLGCVQHCERLQRIFDRLVAEARRQTPRAAVLPWSLTVLHHDDTGAFALPDGQVVVSETLIEERGLSDEALAFVLAPEMAHSILEHERQMLTAGRLLLPRQVERSVPDMYVELEHNFGLLKSLEPVLQQGEFEADELGLLLAALAGYAPTRQLEFMQNEVAEDDGLRPVAATHPPAAERLARLQERLPLAWRLVQSRREPAGRRP
ncbi:hypothetical protein C1M51_04785 [Methylibium sp. Pch-M]|uniref:M48 family metalloprotease n=1 Tax=Methylibium sp. Pch-M TaxID=2082386 RepID=UPI00101194F4|nr:M48 family metalloprotease [Methylibium sp. Pch-M]QAZ38800.1 hypothetical protein C1M51_04785 [Methylibium sp. Pch-M]